MNSDENITIEAINQTIQTMIINQLLDTYSHSLTTQAAPNMGRKAALLSAGTGAQLKDNVKFPHFK